MVSELNQLTLAAIQAEAEKESILPLSNKQIRQNQRDDNDMRKIITHVQAGVKPSKEERRLESKEFQQYCQDFELLYTLKGTLYKNIGE